MSKNVMFPRFSVSYFVFLILLASIHVNITWFRAYAQFVRAPPKNKLTKMYILYSSLAFILSTALLVLLYLLGSLTPAIALAFITTVAVLLITSVLIGYRIGFQQKYDPSERSSK